MSYRKILCCCRDNGKETLNESGGSRENDEAIGVVNQGAAGLDDEGAIAVHDDGAMGVDNARDNGVSNENNIADYNERARGVDNEGAQMIDPRILGIDQYEGYDRNPRNKCALKPGHSQLDWFRLSKNGDLTGLGQAAGTLRVTPEELAKHNTITDGWLAVNGEVYNVTRYFPFHPGGVDELKKGLGIDATQLFFEAHSWVNISSTLQCCHVGHLVPSQLEPLDVSHNDVEMPLRATNDPIDIIENKPLDINKDIPESFFGFSFKSFNEEPDLGLSTINPFNDHMDPVMRSPIPRFDWTQKTASVCMSFEDERFSNPIVGARKRGMNIFILLRYEKKDKVVLNRIILDEDIIWPGALRINGDHGTVELNVKKAEPKLWTNYGVLVQMISQERMPATEKNAYLLTKKREIAEDLFLLELTLEDQTQIYVPIGYHVRIFKELEYNCQSRSYTPIPNIERDLFPKIENYMKGGLQIHLLVKRYENGNVSKYICDSKVGDMLLLSAPISGKLPFSELSSHYRLLMIAAGTGITPMLSLMQSALHRRTNKCQKLGLLWCNRRTQSIPFLRELNDLAANDERLYLRHILTEPNDGVVNDDRFIRGPITEEIVAQTLNVVCRVEEKDYYVVVCGSASFNEACRWYLKKQRVPNFRIHVFEG